MNPEHRTWPWRGFRALLLLGTAGLLLSGCSEGATPALYRKHCANCHGRDGEGLRELFPPLTGSLYLADRLPALPCLLTTGRSAETTAGRERKAPGHPVRFSSSTTV